VTAKKMPTTVSGSKKLPAKGTKMAGKATRTAAKPMPKKTRKTPSKGSRRSIPSNPRNAGRNKGY
jgi:hypothetical protein